MPKKSNYSVKGKEFIINDYNNTKPFSSFFPAVSGEWGKPAWTFYVNRGQGIACFGTKDKDGAITEFQAANKAYRQTSLQGFRTFIKVNGSFYEPFKNDINNVKNKITQTMHITSHMLKFVDTNKKLGIETTVEYFTLPNESFPALVRRLIINNISNENKNIEFIDGLPLSIPYGTNNFLLKHISRLAEGWYNGVFFSKKHKVPVYKLPVEPLDRPEVIPVISGNFYAGFYSDKGKVKFPKFIIDSDVAFGEVRDFAYPDAFLKAKENDFKIDPNLSGKNKTPSAMGYISTKLEAGKAFVYNSVIGNAFDANDIDDLVTTVTKEGYIDKKQAENIDLINTICNNVLTKSSSEKFDNYCQQNFLDNLLRGGYPVTLGKGDAKKNYYVYSRIHGDMEREYNNFVILPEYFSQGNGNYRDVNQNRRCDVFFNQEIKDEQIILFMNLIQLDGFNPLKILGSEFKITKKNNFLKIFKEKDKKNIDIFIKSTFSLGRFFNFIENDKIKFTGSKQDLLNNLLACSERIDHADPGECYWSDHWHYNLDLIEMFLAIYPENLEKLLLNKKVFTFYDNQHVVLPRSDKYVLFDGIPRQIDAVYINNQKEKMILDRKSDIYTVRTKFGKGNIYKTTLMGKLLSLIANKYASMDPECIGLEMESDRPDWCDALNGLPGSFGSSTSESFELKRFLLFVKTSLDKLSLKDDSKISTATETIDFINGLKKITISADTDFKFWDETHTLKEKYRNKTIFGISGKEQNITIEEIKEIVELFLNKISKGLEKALDKKTGVILTNFEYLPTKYSVIKEKGKIKKNTNGHNCITVKEFKQIPLPLFLEGPVHFLRMNKDKNVAQKLHKNISNSGLYDKELDMIKVNAPLGNTSRGIGRITIFTAGWLENESVWLHMEYKYFLELLRNNLSEEYFKLSETALVPFLDPEVYGRSIFENSSFIVSSSHPEVKSHGQGYVSRLSGSTAEFISMWICMTTGLKPFCLDENDQLCVKFTPQISSSLFTKEDSVVDVYDEKGNISKVNVPKNSFLFKFLSKTVVIYHNPGRKNTYGKKGAIISDMKLTYKNGKTEDILGDIIFSPYAKDIRNGKVSQIDITLS